VHQIEAGSLTDWETAWPDAAVFNYDAIAPETADLNASIIARLAAGPDVWSIPVAEIRAARAEGRGSYPLMPPDPHASERLIDGPGGPIGLRVIRPQTCGERGTYLHFHGGGWMMGTPAENDSRLRRHAEATGLVTVSVDYRLAPEHPYPCAPDDCEAAALWLADPANHDLPTGFMAIGGESAGAHLGVVTLVRLRDSHGLMPFDAANLTAGCFDLAMTPSARNWGTVKLILSTRDVRKFIALFVPDGVDTADPDVSPLCARLSGLPPALFSCGTKDLLLDDTLFMAARWRAAGNRAALAIHPGGCHVFQAFETKQAAASLCEMDRFLNAMIEMTRTS